MASQQDLHRSAIGRRGMLTSAALSAASLAALGGLVRVDEHGLAYSRSTGEVLNIVYLGGRPNGFGFFPDRLNGVIR